MWSRESPTAPQSRPRKGEAAQAAEQGEVVLQMSRNLPTGRVEKDLLYHNVSRAGWGTEQWHKLTNFRT